MLSTTIQEEDLPPLQESERSPERPLDRLSMGASGSEAAAESPPSRSVRSRRASVSPTASSSEPADPFAFHESPRKRQRVAILPATTDSVGAGVKHVPSPTLSGPGSSPSSSGGAAAASAQAPARKKHGTADWDADSFVDVDPFPFADYDSDGALVGEAESPPPLRLAKQRAPHSWATEPTTVEQKLAQLAVAASRAHPNEEEGVTAAQKLVTGLAQQFDDAVSKRAQSDAEAQQKQCSPAAVQLFFAAALSCMRFAGSVQKHEALAVLELVSLHITMTDHGWPVKSATAAIRRALDKLAKEGDQQCRTLLKLLKSMHFVIKLVKQHELLNTLDVQGSLAEWRKLIEKCDGSALHKLKSFAIPDIIAAFITCTPHLDRRRRLRAAWFPPVTSSSLTSSAQWRHFLELPDPQRKGKKAAPEQARASPFSAIVVYVDTKPQANDPWLVTVPKQGEQGTAEAQHSEVFSLLQRNSMLAWQMLRGEDGAIAHHGASTPASLKQLKHELKSASSLSIGEYAMQDVHMLLELRKVQKEASLALINIIFCPASAVEAALRLLGPDDSESRVQTRSHSSQKSAGKPADPDTRPQCAPQLLDFADGCTDCVMDFSYADSWSAAVAAAAGSGAELRVAYIRTLMWFSHFNTEAIRQQRVTQLLTDAAAGGRVPAQYPPNCINATYDDKAKNYDMFADFMLDQQWLSIEQEVREQPGKLDARVDAIFDELLRFVEKHAGTDKFVLKGSHATCETSYRSFYRNDTNRMKKSLRFLVYDLYQHSVGIQVYSAAMREAGEYRVWLMAARSRPARPLQLVPIHTVLTRPTVTACSKLLTAMTPDSASDASLKCNLLVADMMKHPKAKAFWRNLLDDSGELSMPALRVDTFYDAETGLAQFNEMAPIPDAVIFSKAADSSLVKHIAKHTAQRLLALAAAD